MNKKVNTILFILGATVFNIMITVLAFFLLLILYAKIMRFLPQGAQAWSFPLIFITSLVISFFVYKVVLGFLVKKIDVEKYFDPIIKSRYQSKKGE
jgi:riboflavin transporter FmnP